MKLRVLPSAALAVGLALLLAAALLRRGEPAAGVPSPSRPPEATSVPLPSGPEPPAPPPREPRPAGGRQSAAAGPTPSRDVARYRALALDEGEDPEERVVALQRLRSAEPDGRTPKVVKSMLELLLRTPDPEVREDLCRHLDGAVAAGQEGPLLQVLSSDVSEAVRAEAAETLSSLRAHPPVRAALERAARDDASEDVRERAARALNP